MKKAKLFLLKFCFCLWLKCAYFILRYMYIFIDIDIYRYIVTNTTHTLYLVCFWKQPNLWWISNYELITERTALLLKTANQVLCCHVFGWLISSATLQYNLCLHHILHGTSVVHAFDTSKFWHFTDVTQTIYCGIVGLWGLPFILYIGSLHWTTEHCAC